MNREGESRPPPRDRHAGNVLQRRRRDAAEDNPHDTMDQAHTVPMAALPEVMKKRRQKEVAVGFAVANEAGVSGDQVGPVEAR
jgi:hypothetical protein